MRAGSTAPRVYVGLLPNTCLTLFAGRRDRGAPVRAPWGDRRLSDGDSHLWSQEPLVHGVGGHGDKVYGEVRIDVACVYHHME